MGLVWWLLAWVAASAVLGPLIGYALRNRRLREESAFANQHATDREDSVQPQGSVPQRPEDRAS